MKPTLPSVKDAPWLKPYKHSGICPPNAFLLMFGLGALVGAVIGAVGYFGGYVTYFLAGLGISLLAWIGGCLGKCLGTVFTIVYGFLLVVIIGLGYPLLLGALLGYAVWLLAKKGKSRNPGWAGFAGFLCGAIAYGVFVFLTLQLAGGLHETSQLTKYIDLPSTSTWMYVIVAVDGLILIITSLITATSMVGDTPFCESCGNWYLEPQKASYRIDAAEPLLYSVKTGYLEGLKGYRTDSPGFPRLELALQKCPCENGEFRLRVTSYWQETKIEKKETKTEDKNEIWFTTMLAPSFGRSLAALFSAPIEPAPETIIKPSPIPEPVMPESSREVIDASNKKCPNCGKEIKAEARLCRFCKATFDVVSRGYCTTCHQVMDADLNNNCVHCGTALADIHIESKMIQTTPRSDNIMGSTEFSAAMLAARETKDEIRSKYLVQQQIRCDQCGAVVKFTEAFNIGTEKIDGTTHRVTRAPWLACPKCGTTWIQF